MVTVLRPEGVRWRAGVQLALAAYWTASGLSDLLLDGATGWRGWVDLLFGLAWAGLAVVTRRERVELTPDGLRIVTAFRTRSASTRQVAGVRRHHGWQDAIVLVLHGGEDLRISGYGRDLHAGLRERVPVG